MKFADLEYPASMAVIEFCGTYKTSMDPNLWAKMILEEAFELQEALADFKSVPSADNKAALLKELVDLAYVSIGGDLSCWVLGDTEAVIDILPEDKRFSEATLEAAAMFPESIVVEAFKRVHASNMSKLGNDGKPIRREDGKVLKGPNYKPPYLLDLVS
jgi:hypothetical protein